MDPLTYNVFEIHQSATKNITGMSNFVMFSLQMPWFHCKFGLRLTEEPKRVTLF